MGRGKRRFAFERSHACSVREFPGSGSPPSGGLSAHSCNIALPTATIIGPMKIENDLPKRFGLFVLVQRQQPMN